MFRRAATKTAIMSVVLAMKTVIRFRTIWTNWATRPIPSVCVMSLSQEQIFEGKTPEDLLSFFREPRFENPIGEILIETKTLQFPQKTPKSFTVSIPIHFFLKSLTNNQRIEALELFCKATKIWIIPTDVKVRMNLKLMYFLFELAVWFTIRREKITLITTQSTMNNLPRAFEISNSSFDRKMFWYSTNSQPILKKGSVLVRPIFSQSLNRKIDMHYVWDQNSKDFLVADGITKVKVVGSILFVKPEFVRLDYDDFNLAYFDVTPFEHADTYYTSERMCANLSKIVEITSQMSAKSKLSINLFVKPKREINPNHSREYVQMLINYKKDGKLQMLNPEENIYGIAKSVDCIIGIPFTSPVVVGRELAIPSTYIDVYQDNYQIPEIHNGFTVISDDIQLASWLEKYLQEHSTN